MSKHPHTLCPTCGQKIRAPYRFKLDDADVSALRKIHQYVLEQGTYEVDVRKANLSYTERSRTTQLRFHGLLTKARTKGGTHKASTWILTRRAADFLKGITSVAKYVYTQNNSVVGHSEDRVWKHDYKILKNFGPHWDALDLSDGNVRIVPRSNQQTLL